MSTYTEYVDKAGRDERLRRDAWNAARARMLAALQEFEFGAITLYMSKRDLQTRLRESAYVGTEHREA